MNKVYEKPSKIRISANAKDLTDKVLGKVTVLYPAGRETENNHLMWLCECECGTMFTARAHVLYSDRIRSCGQCEHENPRTELKEIPYHLEDGDGPHEEQLSLDLSEHAEPSSVDEPLFGLMDELSGDGIKRRDMAEIDALRNCCVAMDAVPPDAHARVVEYLKAKYCE